MYYKRPLWSSQLPPDTSTALARLAGIDGFARAILVSVLPLIAIKAFGSKEAVSSVYFFSTIFTLLITINISTLEQWLNRRGLMTLSGLFLITAVFLFYSEKAALFAIGIGLRAAAASIFSVCMSLYILDYIGKRDLTRNESRRMIYMGVAWLIGPAFGGWIFGRTPSYVIYLIASVSGAAMLGYFWYIRLGDNDVIRAAKKPSVNPLTAVRRFVQQPRLRIAYLITLTRSCYWTTLFVYGPIYVIEAGLPSWIGGILLSGVSGLLFLSPLVRWLADRFGTRQLIIACALLISSNLIVLGIIGDPVPIGLLFWVLGAVGGACMDVLANIPFLRLVKVHERTEMTMVFTTWRESSSLITQALVYVTLLVAPFWAFYFVLAAMLLSVAVATTYLPRRL